MPKRRLLFLIAIVAELGACTGALIGIAPFLAFQFIFIPGHMATAFVLASWLASWWLMTPRYELEGVISPTEAAKLQNIVSELSRTLNAPKIHRIVLNDELNAFASQTPGIFSLLLVKRTLVLGIPLLAALSENEVKAVIAHELGHFSRNHNRMGQWLYRVRNRWCDLLPRIRRKTTPLSRLLQPVSLIFIPYFLRATSDWSRFCEFEADQACAKTKVAQGLATGLAKLNALEHVSNWRQAKAFDPTLRQSETAPDKFWTQALAYAASDWSGNFDKSMVGVYRRGRRILDTHPAYHDRINALGITNVPKISSDTVCAGASLFPNTWNTLLSEVNARWQRANQTDWLVEHLRLHGVYGSTKPNMSTADLHYQKGSALLRDGQAHGIEQLKTAFKLDPAYGLLASREILGYEQVFGTDDTLGKAEHRYAHYRKLSSISYKDLIQKLDKGEYAGLPGDIHTRIASLLQRYPVVDGAWCLMVTGPFTSLAYPVVVWFMMRVDPKIAEQSGATEESIAAHLSQFLSAMLPANYRYLMLPAYSTEPFNPYIYRILQSAPETCLVAARTPVNEGLLTIDTATIR